MTPQLAAPFIGAVLAALSARLLQRRLPPAPGTWLLAGLAAGATIAVLAAELLASATYLAGIGWVSDRVGWCRTLAASQHAPSTVVGLAALGAITIGSLRALRVMCRYRRMTSTPSDSPLIVVQSAEAQAFAVPGKPGHVHVTTAMLNALDEDGRRVLFAHESAHLDLSHHRFVHMGSIAAALFPPLRPLANQISFCTERWADEVAAAKVGDRRTTARAIAAAAFATTSPPYALGLVDLGVAGRVEALLATGGMSRSRCVIVGGTALLVLNFAGGVVQMHHLVMLIHHVCSA